MSYARSGRLLHLVAGACLTATAAAQTSDWCNDGAEFTGSVPTTGDSVGASDEFGTSVDLDGRLAVAGTPYAAVLPDGGSTQLSEAGEVFIFEDDISTGWGQVAYFNADDTLSAYAPQAGNWFGSSVAIDGNTVVVSEPGRASDQGVVHVFESSAGVWGFVDTLIASDGQADDHFGGRIPASATEFTTRHAVDISGDWIVVGAPGVDLVAPDNAMVTVADAGQAYIFHWNGSAWVEDAILIMDNLVAADAGGLAGPRFGAAVAIDGRTAVVGAPFKGDNGTVYIFEYNTTLSQWEAASPARIEPDCPDSPLGVTSNARFGESLDIEGDTILCGSPRGEFAAAIQKDGMGVWATDEDLCMYPQSFNPLSNSEYFGFSVDLDGDYALISADIHPRLETQLDDSCGITAFKAGIAELFVLNTAGDGYDHLLVIRPPGGDTDWADGDKFGERVAMDGGRAIFGAPGHMVGSNGNQGAVFFYDDLPSCPACTGCPADAGCPDCPSCP